MNVATFLKRHWQKKPLLIRQALPGLAQSQPLTAREVLTLAKREEAESRLVVRHGKQWTLKNGPIQAKDLQTATNMPWTILVQDTQHFSYEAHEILKAFSFVPHARMDDLMVSLAAQGGGVGPHVDSYDVFLLQGAGRRRWQIADQADLKTRTDVPLKMLASFRPEQEWVLEAGDMLYLPPGYAHNGVAETDGCMTWSVGFRAPGGQELGEAFLDFLRDTVCLPGQYADPDLRPAAHPGLLDEDCVSRFSALLKPLAKHLSDAALHRRFLGRYLTEPKPHVIFDSPDDPFDLKSWSTLLRNRGVELDLKSRLLFDQHEAFLNGETLIALVGLGASEVNWLRMLADHRYAGPIRQASLPLRRALLSAYDSGYLHPARLTR